MSFYISHFSKKLPRLSQGKPLSVIGYVHDDVSGDREIDNLVEKNEKDKKIIDLFKAQLLLPINKRSKALMARFGIDVTKNGQVDAWPTTKAVRFHVNCYMPVDTAVQDTSRLVGTKSKVLGLFNEESTGNTYFYYFPVSMHGVEENNILKIDRLNTWIYRDTGEPVPDIGDEYNLYHALYDHLNGRNIATSRAYLTSLGMYSEATGVTFTLRNHGILVDSSVRNPGNSALNLIEQQPTNTPAANVSAGELNQKLLPIGEGEVDPREALDDLIEKMEGQLEDFDYDYPVKTKVDEDPNPDDAEVEPEAPKVDEIVEAEPEAPKVDEIVETEPEALTDANGLFSLDVLVKNPEYAKVQPFAQLATKYKKYKVQINKSLQGQGYSKLKYPQFVIQNIDKDKKRIEIVYHETASSRHKTKTGRSDKEVAFNVYNSEFISAGNAEDALKNMKKEYDVGELKKRMGVFTREKYENFQLEVKLDLMVND